METSSSVSSMRRLSDQALRLLRPEVQSVPVVIWLARYSGILC
ncbi:hypothetical protein AVDCRST_MAG81-5427 [uncultured Synechococcales cyanobacterium]|uniref:Uncharacterized protein n=1 Tax=uncultured Synechococcales cyanobacterium TaxID=1936017 RepID=A0A6J4VVB3_9CYAN|nr:hypothetical protein AVDCRST_MAG81-5427 [uncultured Synechococcales cyanobacterium]